MHMSDAPVPPQPVTNSAPVTTQEQSASYNDLKAPNRPNVVATIKPAEHSSTNAPKDAVVAQIERDYAKAHAQLIRRFSEGEQRQIAVELAQAEDKAQVEAEQRYSPEDVMGESTYQNELTERYVGEVLRKYHLNASQRGAINVEAIENHWPLPDPPSPSQ